MTNVLAPTPPAKTDGVDSDEALMRRVAAGDHEACALLVDRHLRGVLGLARRLVGPEAEDVAQEVFLRIWEKASGWKETDARFTTWLYRITYNLSIDHLRRRRPTGAPSEDAVAPEPGPLTERHQREIGAWVEAAIAALPERQRAALTLCYHQELSNREAAAILGVGIEALESLLARARRGLRAQLESKKDDLLPTD